jgi:ribosomal-protein-alanine N-acetyltransferase
MKATVKYVGERIYLKSLTQDDITQTYVKWLNDSEINKYLESRWQVHTVENIWAYVSAMNDSNNNVMFGIFLKDFDRHIGNIKIGSINRIHNYADMGLIIGERGLWGKGFATESIIAATAYGLQELKLNKIFAGIYADNIGSYKAFIKAGYEDAGRLRNHRISNGVYVDEILVEKCRDN